MDGGGDEVAAESIHLCERSDLAGVAEVIGVFASGERRAGGRLNRNEVRVLLTADLIAHERGDKAAEVGAAAGAADDDVGVFVIHLHCRLGFNADYALMQQHLVEHRAEHVAAVVGGDGGFDCFGDSAAERAGGVGHLGEYRSACIGGVAGAGDYLCAEGLNDVLAEGLLIVAALDHVDGKVEAEVSAGHRERRAPLTCTGLGGQVSDALLLGVICLGDRGVQLVAARGVVALKFIIDLCGGAELLLKAVGPDKRGGAAHFVEFLNFVGDVDISVGVVKLLHREVVAEDGFKLLGLGYGLHRAGVEHGVGQLLHIGTHIIPLLREIFFGKVDSVGYIL